MLKKEWLEIRAMEKGQLSIEGAEEEIIEKIKKSEAKDDKIVKIVEEMKKVLWQPLVKTTNRLLK